MLQAYMDDSYTRDGVFVLGGHIASTETWASFSEEWSEMLPNGVLASDGTYHFKMSEMALSPERMERVQWFFRIIERHRLIPISIKVNAAELRRALARIWSLDSIFTDRVQASNPFRLAFRGLMDLFHSNRALAAPFVPEGERVDFIFDEQTEKKSILAEWDEYISKRPPETKGYYGAAPRFENDRAFLPLQAADLWAWWIRRWYEAGEPEKREGFTFGRWNQITFDRIGIHMTLNEDDVVRNFIEMAKSQVSNAAIYDSDAAKPLLFTASVVPWRI